MYKFTNLIRNINLKLKYINDQCYTTSYFNIKSTQFINNSSCIARNYCQSHQIKCWNCGVEKKTHFEIFCDKCNIIQQPHNKDNYFKVIGIDESYDVDLKALSKKYRQLQSVLHPDKYSNKSDEEKQISEEYSSVVNRAYNTLQSPINRGLHLLALRGEKINENEDKNTEQEFLMEIMELNEEVEEAETPDQLLNLNKKNRKILQEIANELSEAFKSGNVLNAKKVLIRMKYYTSVSLQINGILREKGIVE